MARQEVLFENSKQIKELDDAIETYQDLKEKRIKLLAKEVDAKDAVRGLMKENKLKKYYYEDLGCEIVPGEEELKTHRLKPKPVAKED